MATVPGALKSNESRSSTLRMPARRPSRILLIVDLSAGAVVTFSVAKAEKLLV
jgi:hypothetical protein